MLVNQWTNAIKQVREARTALRELLSAVPTSLHEIQSWYNHPPSTSDDDDGADFLSQCFSLLQEIVGLQERLQTASVWESTSILARIRKLESNLNSKQNVLSVSERNLVSPMSQAFQNFQQRQKLKEVAKAKTECEDHIGDLAAFKALMFDSRSRGSKAVGALQKQLNKSSEKLRRSRDRFDTLNAQLPLHDRLTTPGGAPEDFTSVSEVLQQSQRNKESMVLRKAFVTQMNRLRRGKEELHITTREMNEFLRFHAKRLQNLGVAIQENASLCSSRLPALPVIPSIFTIPCHRIRVALDSLLPADPFPVDEFAVQFPPEHASMISPAFAALGTARNDCWDRMPHQERSRVTGWHAVLLGHFECALHRLLSSWQLFDELTTTRIPPQIQQHNINHAPHVSAVAISSSVREAVSSVSSSGSLFPDSGFFTSSTSTASSSNPGSAWVASITSSNSSVPITPSIPGHDLVSHRDSQNIKSFQVFVDSHLNSLQRRIALSFWNSQLESGQLLDSVPRRQLAAAVFPSTVYQPHWTMQTVSLQTPGLSLTPVCELTEIPPESVLRQAKSLLWGNTGNACRLEHVGVFNQTSIQSMLHLFEAKTITVQVPQELQYLRSAPFAAVPAPQQPLQLSKLQKCLKMLLHNPPRRCLLAKDPEYFITTAELASLAMERLIDDNIMSWACCLLRELPGVTQNHHILGSLNSQSLSSDSEYDTALHLPPGLVDRGPCNIWFPVVHHSHWGLACLDLLNNQVLYDDSLGQPIPSFLPSTLLLWAEKMNSRHPGWVPAAMLSQLRLKQSPLRFHQSSRPAMAAQISSSSCGILVIEYLRSVLLRLPFPDSVFVQYYRLRLLSDLVDSIPDSVTDSVHFRCG